MFCLFCGSGIFVRSMAGRIFWIVRSFCLEIEVVGSPRRNLVKTCVVCAAMVVEYVESYKV